MCGVAGLIGGPDPGQPVARMTRSLAHRGPDDTGTAPLLDAAGAVRGAFGHCRLSILDLSAAGHQPMASGDRALLTVFNGEIYNFRELREELRSRGVTFHGDSDTEVLLAGWALHGKDFVRRLRGMFAFVIWDGRRRTASFVRDAFGIKPLYLARCGDAIAFASEVRSLLAAGATSPALSREALYAYLATGSASDRAVLISGVTAVEPGTVLEAEVDRQGRATLRAPEPFAGPIAAPGADEVLSGQAAAGAVRRALRDSVEAHLVSDVPVGIFLSGGVDSSAIVALASEVSASRLDTFTVTLGDPAFDESPFAAAVARRYGTRHHEEHVDGAALLAALPDAFAAMDQPSLDGLNTYAVSAAVRRAGIKVVLSGLGGDELFAGYPSFARARMLARAWPRSAALRGGAARVAAHMGGRGAKVALALAQHDPALAAYSASRALFAGDWLDRLLPDAATTSLAPALPPQGLSLLGRVSWYELTGYMRNTLLRDSDVFSMAHGLELRVPFLDRAVADAAARTPDDSKLDAKMGKPLLVSALVDLLPREVWDRPKRGFVLPFEHWLRNELRAPVGLALTDEARVERVGLSPAAVAGVWSAFLNRDPAVSWSRPWSLYVLVEWAERVGAEVERESASPALARRRGAPREEALS